MLCSPKLINTNSESGHAAERFNKNTLALGKFENTLIGIGSRILSWA